MKMTLWRMVAVLGLTTLLYGSSAEAQMLGETRVLRTTYGASANWNGSDNKKAVIHIEPGWAIIDKKDERSSNFGRTSLNVSTFPANAQYVSVTEIESRFREVSDHMFKFGNIAGQRRAEELKNQWIQSRANISSSFAGVEILASATGSGNVLTQKGASIQGSYIVTVKYFGTNDVLKKTLDDLMRSVGPLPQPQPASRTLVFPSGGRVRKQADGSWVEIGSNGKFVSRFRQISQDANVLVLCHSRILG